MFLHNFKYAFKTLIRNKTLIFWTYAFPLILGTFFNMAFSNIESSEKFDIIDIAVVNNNDFKENDILKESIKQLSDKSNEDRIFNTRYVDEDKAEALLEDGKIEGYLLINDDKASIVVDESGINQTIFKSVVEEIIQTADIVNKDVEAKLSSADVNNAMSDGSFMGDYTEIVNKIVDDSVESVTNQTADIKNISKDNLSYTMIEFYTLIAMTCLYGGIIGMTAMNSNLPNMSSNGKRLAMGPVSKGKVILSSVAAGYIIQLIGLVILFIYTIFALKVDYGNKLGYIILLALIGSFAGLTLGIAIGAVFKSGENAKIGIVIAVTMAGCFLSGMMGITMKYVIDTNVPLVNKINPAAMITDGFYSLYYYDTTGRFMSDLAGLAVFSAVMLVLSLRSLRRIKYDSI